MYHLPLMNEAVHYDILFKAFEASWASHWSGAWLIAEYGDFRFL
jgi:hypothetical protein